MEEQKNKIGDIIKKSIKVTAKSILRTVGLPVLIIAAVLIILVAAAYAEDLIEIKEDKNKKNNGPAAVRTYQSATIASSYAPSTSSGTTNSTQNNYATVVPSSEGGGYVNDPQRSYVDGYYTSSKGKVFTIYVQGRINGSSNSNWAEETRNWHDKCNRAAAAIIASGYSNETPEEGIEHMNNDYLSSDDRIFGVVPNTAVYWSDYGLRASRETDLSNFQEKIKNQLVSGGYAMIWMSEGQGQGKTTLWTTWIHWVAIVDYRTTNGNFEMCVLDARGVTWVPEDEFQKGISCLIFINEAN